MMQPFAEPIGFHDLIFQRMVMSKNNQGIWKNIVRITGKNNSGKNMD